MVTSDDTPEDVLDVLRDRAEIIIGQRPKRIQVHGRTKAAFILKNEHGENVGFVRASKGGRAEAANLQLEVLRTAWIDAQESQEASEGQAASYTHSLAPASAPPVPAVASPPRPAQEETVPQPAPVAAPMLLPPTPSTSSVVGMVVVVVAAVVAAAVMAVILRAAVVVVAIASNAAIVYHICRNWGNKHRAGDEEVRMQAVTPVSAARRPRTFTPMSVEAATPDQNWGAGPMDISPG